MQIGRRLRALRRKHKLSQGDVAKRTGLLRTYLSRVENGHTIPSLDTIERLAQALGIPVYRIFYDGKRPPRQPRMWLGASRGKRRRKSDDAMLGRLLPLFARMGERHRRLLLQIAERMAVERQNRRPQKSLAH